jgi:two-component system cell cycle sensor histidine kinase/response regulator CckA
LYQRAGTILVVEDEEEVRRLLIRSLQGLNLDIAEAADGEQGLQAARRLAASLRLVVTDINMPGMSGIELAREFRPTQPRVPILFITGVDSRTAALEADRLGAELLLKPFGPDLFVNTVTRVLDQASPVTRSPA